MKCVLLMKTRSETSLKLLRLHSSFIELMSVRQVCVSGRSPHLNPDISSPRGKPEEWKNGAQEGLGGGMREWNVELRECLDQSG